MEETAASEARVVLAEPHRLVVEALAWLLEAGGLTVVGHCTHASELERCLRCEHPDIVLVDSELAAPAAAVALVRRLGASNAGLVLLVPAVDPALARDALAADVDGVLLKTAGGDDVVAGLWRIAAGDAVYPAGWLTAARRARGGVDDDLSGRQREVLELLAEGLPNETIAERLFISKNTVKFHVAAIYQRLGVRNRVQAARALGALGDPKPGRDRDHPPGWEQTTPRAVSPLRSRP